MNLLKSEVERFAQNFRQAYQQSAEHPAEVGIAPPYTALPWVQQCFDGIKGVRIGAQNVHWLESGAHTGEISAPMLKEYGVDFAIIGHSERRQFYGETDEAVSMRAQTAIQNGITAVVCIGETKEQFEANQSQAVVKTQLYGSLGELNEQEVSKLVVAYEPVWAIGTGLAATPELASDMHEMIRKELLNLFENSGENIPILYGGSTKPENILELMAKENINGALVGGASLLPESFAKMIELGSKANSLN
jgi:triosephosphate isomerase